MAMTASMIENREGSPFRVYFKHNQTLIELKFSDHKMRVEEVIEKSIGVLSDIYMLRLNTNTQMYALYQSNREGHKIKDAIEISHNQRVRSVGGKRFFL